VWTKIRKRLVQLLERYGARVLCPPKRNARKKKPWPKRLRRWFAGLRQIVESVYEKLHNAFGLARERPRRYHDYRIVEL